MEEFLYPRRKGLPISSRASSSIPIQQFNRNLIMPVCISSISSNDSEITITATSEDEESSSQMQFKNHSNQYKDTPVPFSNTFENRFDKSRELQEGSLYFNNIHIPGNNNICSSEMNKFRPGSTSSSSTVTKISSKQLHKHKKSPKNHSQSKNWTPKEKIKKLNESAILIQKTWKGYYVRNKNPIVQQMKTDIRLNRIEEHIFYFLKHVYPKNSPKKVQEDLNQSPQDTRQLVIDQTNSPKSNILEPNSLSKISNLKNENPRATPKDLDMISSSNQENSSNSIIELKKTCVDLQKQVLELKDTMRGIVENISRDSLTDRRFEDQHKSIKTNPTRFPMQNVSKITFFSDKKTKNTHGKATSSSLDFLVNFESRTFDVINNGENVVPNSNLDSLRFTEEIVETKNSSFQRSTTFLSPISVDSNNTLQNKNYIEIYRFVSGLVDDIINASLQRVVEFEASKVKQNIDDNFENSHDNSFFINSFNESPSSVETTDTFKTFPVILGDDSYDCLDIFLNQIHVDSSESSN
ncbi:uncharacterized protein [Lepeophtheirus salmonis]|uniref:uncharacterized protein isoform X2 n=1 Tax=Lepeophtheirus salmonis TaxID=72036 RepID=UPI001AE37D38|nr:uncharacterized protein LOC121120362 isoform X2 [Lepeophtheirus salmonis]